MPVFSQGGNRVYRSERHGRNVDLIMLDQRQYRADQSCGDAVAPPCADWDQPRPFLGRNRMTWLRRGLRTSRARWKVIGSQTMMMPAKVTGGSFYAFDSWQGYPQERAELLGYIEDRGIDDVVFLTGDIHLFIAGDVRRNMGDGESVAVESVGGSITSTNFGEMDIDAGGGVIIRGNDANPNTPQEIIDALRGINPWVDQADFDHHGYGLVEASRGGFECTLKRLETIKRRSRAQLPVRGYRYRLERGQKSIKGVNGPAGERRRSVRLTARPELSSVSATNARRLRTRWLSRPEFATRAAAAVSRTRRSGRPRTAATLSVRRRPRTDNVTAGLAQPGRRQWLVQPRDRAVVAGRLGHEPWLRAAAGGGTHQGGAAV